MSIFRVPPKDANSKFLRNTAIQTTCYPNLHHIMFIHHCQKTEAKNLVDGSCRKNWITSTTLCSEPTLHDVMWLHFAPHLSYGFYCLVKW